jgi:hypothetical protein
VKRLTFALAAGLFLAGTATTQDLPPGVLLFSRVQRHTKEGLQQLPNISCLETVQREHKSPNARMAPLDTIRLEVLTDGKNELFASPGDRKFSERHPISYVGSGIIGNGPFGLYLQSILTSGYASNAYKGEEEIGGRRLARWDYSLSPAWSGEYIQLLEGSGTVGLHGSYWADPETYDVIRLELNADNIPSTLPLVKAVTSINYERTHLSDTLAVLLPQSSEFLLVKNSGETSHNRVEFTHCRTFGADSSINFGEPDAAAQTPHFSVGSVDDTMRSLPAGLQITVKLRSRISTGTAVGALIDGVVAANVPAKGAVVIAAGSPVRGRVRRLERYRDPVPHFVVALEFTQVELEGIRHRFYADLVRIESAPGVEQKLPALTETGWVTLHFSLLPGVATFFLKGSSLDLPVDFRTVWKTRKLAP